MSVFTGGVPKEFKGVLEKLKDKKEWTIEDIGAVKYMLYVGGIDHLTGYFGNNPNYVAIFGATEKERKDSIDEYTAIYKQYKYDIEYEKQNRQLIEYLRGNTNITLPKPIFDAKGLPPLPTMAGLPSLPQPDTIDHFRFNLKGWGTITESEYKNLRGIREKAIWDKKDKDTIKTLCKNGCGYALTVFFVHNDLFKKLRKFISSSLLARPTVDKETHIKALLEAKQVPAKSVEVKTAHIPTIPHSADNDGDEENKYRIPILPFTSAWKDSDSTKSKDSAELKDDPNMCLMCNVKPGIKHCAKCKRVKYCSRECQVRAWPAHKMLCTPPS